MKVCVLERCNSQLSSLTLFPQLPSTRHIFCETKLEGNFGNTEWPQQKDLYISRDEKAISLLDHLLIKSTSDKALLSAYRASST